MAALVLFTVALPASAGGIGGGLGKVFRKGNKSSGRSDVADLRGKAHFRIPAGFNYLTGDELVAFEKEAENPVEPDEVGLLVPESGDWFVVFFVTTDDPLMGLPKENIDADALLAKLRAKTEADNRSRKAAGLPLMRITGWTHKPAYDKATNRVTWGYRLLDEDDDQDAINYETILFGPNGETVDVMLVAETKAYKNPLAEYRKVVDSVAFGGLSGSGWLGLSAMADNEKALFIGATVMAIIFGAGMMLRRSAPERKRPAPTTPRAW